MSVERGPVAARTAGAIVSASTVARDRQALLQLIDEGRDFSK